VVSRLNSACSSADTHELGRAATSSPGKTHAVVCPLVCGSSCHLRRTQLIVSALHSPAACGRAWEFHKNGRRAFRGMQKPENCLTPPRILGDNPGSVKKICWC